MRSHAVIVDDFRGHVAKVAVGNKMLQPGSMAAVFLTKVSDSTTAELEAQLASIAAMRGAHLTRLSEKGKRLLSLSGFCSHLQKQIRRHRRRLSCNVTLQLGGYAST